MRHFDLCIIGSGSGNTIVDERFEGQSVAIVEGGSFGGTCVNVGCIPTKMYVHPADLARTPDESGRLGVDVSFNGVDWPGIRDRIFGRIDAIAVGGAAYRRGQDHVTLYAEHATFVGPRTLELDESGTITADRFVIAAGARPVVPPIAGLDDVDFHTSDTVMRLPELPKSMVIVGGGYVAAEFAHVFSAFGTRVTLINRTERLLRGEDAEVAQRFTELLQRQIDVRLNARIASVEPGARGGVRVKLGEGSDPLDAEVLLIATGRRPNSDRLGLGTTGVDVDADGFIVVDAEQRTTADGVFALGDISSPLQLKHVANHEARVVQHNLLSPDAMIASDHRFVPHAVFSRPQIASVGLTEQDARERGLDIRVGRRDFGAVAFGWAMEDRDHFAKVIVDRSSDQILGAHLIGPEASTLIQSLITAMSFGIPAADFARGQYWIHPALTEVVENAVLGAGEDPGDADRERGQADEGAEEG